MTITDYCNLVWTLTGRHPYDGDHNGPNGDTILEEITERLAQNPKMVSLLLKSLADTLEDRVGNCHTCLLREKHYEEL